MTLPAVMYLPILHSDWQLISFIMLSHCILDAEIYAHLYSYHVARAESKVFKIVPKMLLGISQNFHLLCSSTFPLFLHYAPRLATFLVMLEDFNQ